MVGLHRKVRLHHGFCSDCPIEVAYAQGFGEKCRPHYEHRSCVILTAAKVCGPISAESAAGGIQLEHVRKPEVSAGGLPHQDRCQIVWFQGQFCQTAPAYLEILVVVSSHASPQWQGACCASGSYYWVLGVLLKSP